MEQAFLRDVHHAHGETSGIIHGRPPFARIFTDRPWNPRSFKPFADLKLDVRRQVGDEVFHIRLLAGGGHDGVVNELGLKVLLQFFQGCNDRVQLAFLDPGPDRGAMHQVVVHDLGRFEGLTLIGVCSDEGKRPFVANQPGQGRCQQFLLPFSFFPEMRNLLT